MATSTPNVPIFNNTGYVTPEKKTAAPKVQELGKDEFLNLLIAQLKNQDPLNPMKDTEFIAQLATFSTVEQIGNMNRTMEKNFSLGLIGAEVTDSAGLSGTVKDVNIDMKGETVFTVAYQELGKDGKMTDMTREVKFGEISEIAIKGSGGDA